MIELCLEENTYGQDESKACGQYTWSASKGLTGIYVSGDLRPRRQRRQDAHLCGTQLHRLVLRCVEVPETGRAVSKVMIPSVPSDSWAICWGMWTNPSEEEALNNCYLFETASPCSHSCPETRCGDQAGLRLTALGLKCAPPHLALQLWFLPAAWSCSWEDFIICQPCTASELPVSLGSSRPCVKEEAPVERFLRKLSFCCTLFIQTRQLSNCFKYSLLFLMVVWFFKNCIHVEMSQPVSLIYTVKMN